MTNTQTPSDTPTPKKLDARVARTLKSIETAFLHVLSQKDYDDITIADILEHANINRTTFYKYYENKNELAHQMICQLKNELFIPLLDKRLSISWEEFRQSVPSTLQEHLSRLRLLWRITTPKINLKQDYYTLAKNKYISAKASQNKPDGDLQFQGHIYASFSVAMIEFIIQSDEVANPDHIHHNLKLVWEHIVN